VRYQPMPCEPATTFLQGPTYWCFRTTTQLKRRVWCEGRGIRTDYGCKPIAVFKPASHIRRLGATGPLNVGARASSFVLVGFVVPLTCHIRPRPIGAATPATPILSNDPQISEPRRPTTTTIASNASCHGGGGGGCSAHSLARWPVKRSQVFQNSLTVVVRSHSAAQPALPKINLAYCTMSMDQRATQEQQPVRSRASVELSLGSPARNLGSRREAELGEDVPDMALGGAL